MPHPKVHEFTPIQGARVPLFDRLVDDDPDIRKDIRPLRVYARQDLLASVARDVHRLLNSRRASFGPPHTMEATVLAYGIPDFSAMGAASVTDRGLLAETLRTAIATFEPRLLDVTVQFTADPDRQNILSGAIGGRLRIDNMLEPVTFPILLHGAGGEIEILAAPDSNLETEGRDE